MNNGRKKIKSIKQYKKVDFPSTWEIILDNIRIVDIYLYY